MSSHINVFGEICRNDKHGTISDLVAAHIQSARRRQGLTAQQLAAKCAEIGAHQLTTAVIANIETGRRDTRGARRRDVTIDELCAVAMALDVQPADLLGPYVGHPTVQVTPDVLAAPSDLAAWVSGGSNSVVPSLLGGIALCGACHVAVLAVRNANGTAYSCTNPSCPGPRVNRLAVGIDAYVTGATVGMLASPNLIELILPQTSQDRGDQQLSQEIDSLDKKLKDLSKRRAKAQQQLEELADYPHLSAEVLARSLMSFDQRIHELETAREKEEKRALLQRNQGIARDIWDKVALRERRGVIEVLFTITLAAAPVGENASKRASGEIFCTEDIELSRNADT